MEKLKGIGKIAIWLLGHLLMFSIYTVDRVISVFAPWQPMPKYLSWYNYSEIDASGNETNTFLNRSVSRVAILVISIIICILTPIWVWIILAVFVSFASFAIESSISKTGL